MFFKKYFEQSLNLPNDIIEKIYALYSNSFPKKIKINCIMCGIGNLNYYDYLDGVGPICGICQYGL